jgi:hypothetical protein
MALVVALAGCGGASAQQVQTAHRARYKTPPETMYAIALEATREGYTITDEEPASGWFQTLGTWYAPNGAIEPNSATGNPLVHDGSILVGLLVQVTASGGLVAVQVTPVAQRYRQGRPENEKVAASDPTLPSWAQGKADALAVKIYNRAKARSVPHLAPPGGT